MRKDAKIEVIPNSNYAFVSVMDLETGDKVIVKTKPRVIEKIEITTNSISLSGTDYTAPGQYWALRLEKDANVCIVLPGNNDQTLVQEPSDQVPGQGVK